MNTAERLLNEALARHAKGDPPECGRLIAELNRAGDIETLIDALHVLGHVETLIDALHVLGHVETLIDALHVLGHVVDIVIANREE